MNLFRLIRAPNPIKMDEPAIATDLSGVPSTIKKSPLDFANEGGASDQGTAAPGVPPPEDVPTTAAPEVGQAGEAIAAEPSVAREIRKRGHDGVEANAPPKSLRRDHADLRPSGAPANVSDPDSLSFADAPSHHPVDVAQSSPGVVVAEDPESENASSPTEVGSPGSVYRPEWGVTNGNLLDTPEACQDLVDHVAPPGYFFELRHMRNEDFLGQYNVARRDKRIEARELEIKNLEALLETEADMKRAAEDKSAGLIKELEDMRARFSDLQCKQYEDERVERQCAELDARLDALSIDFDEELYLHMLTAIAGRSSSVVKRFKVSFAESVGRLEGCSYG
nr:hypothetical protein [Tanacetum cinerariifolium]